MALKQTLQDAGIRFDIAVIYGWQTEQLKDSDTEVFSGSGHIMEDNPFLKKSPAFVGVAKGDKYLPFPELYAKVAKQKGKFMSLEQEKGLSSAYEFTEDEQGDYYSDDEEKRAKAKKQREERWLKLYDQYQLTNKNITPEDLQDFRDKIKKTRQDIETMAEKVVKIVWKQ